MKKEYDLLEIMVVRFENEDIVTTSAKNIMELAVGDDNILDFDELTTK